MSGCTGSAMCKLVEHARTYQIDGEIIGRDCNERAVPGCDNCARAEDEEEEYEAIEAEGERGRDIQHLGICMGTISR